MRFITTIALVAALACPALRADVVITKVRHSDAVKSVGHNQPVKDTTEVTWMGTDRMRIEEGDKVTIIRADQKKIYMLDVKAKTVSTIDLPFDIKKHVPAEEVPKIEQLLSGMKVTVTPSTETKKIKEWTATKYTMTVTSPVAINFTEVIWATKDIKVDFAAYSAMRSSRVSLFAAGSSIAPEYKKIEGVIVLTERTVTNDSQTSTSRDEVTSVEMKDAPEGTYEVPKDYTAKPFDPLADPTAR